MMNFIAFMQQPPAILLGIALLALPVVTAREGDRSAQSPVRSPFVAAAPTSADIPEDTPSLFSQSEASPHDQPFDPMHADVGLSFSLGPLQSLQRSWGWFDRSESSSQSADAYDLHILFEGDSNSLVAKAVGSAEGTRTPSGDYTSAYRGHVDPGNGVWNLGTFSYQHGASSPEDADRKQLQRLKGQATQIRQRAERAGITLGLEEELNGIDLANQSPLAALGEPGYAEWLADAYRKGYRGTEAILWARVMGYWDVQRGRWNAPGLGNTEPSIRRDQSRRMQAIARTIDQGTQWSGLQPLDSETLDSETPDAEALDAERLSPERAMSVPSESASRSTEGSSTRSPDQPSSSLPSDHRGEPSSKSEGFLDFGLL